MGTKQRKAKKKRRQFQKIFNILKISILIQLFVRMND